VALHGAGRRDGRLPAKGKELRIDVFDTGPGFPKSSRQRIFGEFYQMAGPGPDRNGGLGLGLAIVDRLARLLGHKVELESRPGRGSRFSVTLPLPPSRTLQRRHRLRLWPLPIRRAASGSS